MLVYKIVTLVAFVVASAWAVSTVTFESVTSALAGLAAVVLVFFVEGKRKAASQSQDVGAGGIGIQAGRDASNNKITKK